MPRRGKGGIGLKKLIGIALAVIGVFIIIDLLPMYIWRLLLGLGLMFMGWILFNS